MRLCHLGDSHLGAGENHPVRAESGLTRRQQDLVNAFIEAVDKIIELRPDFCLYAGDLFHVVRPSNRIMAIAAEQLHRLAEEHGIPTVVIAGNHDAPRQLHLGAALEVFEPTDNLYIAARGKYEVFRIGEVAVHAIPHFFTPQVMAEELDRCRPDPAAQYNVLVAHGVAAGMPEFSMADLGEVELPLELLDRFDYAALGHYHNHKQVSGRAWYSGSTERLSQAERTAQKGFVRVDLDPLEIRFQEVSSRPMVDIQDLDASGQRGDEVLRRLVEQVDRVDASDKIVRVQVRGISEEALKTLPTGGLADLKQRAYALDIRFEKEASEEARPIGRLAAGGIDSGFMAYLEAADLRGLDRERLKQEALKYLSADD